MHIMNHRVAAVNDGIQHEADLQVRFGSTWMGRSWKTVARANRDHRHRWHVTWYIPGKEQWTRSNRAFLPHSCTETTHNTFRTRDAALAYAYAMRARCTTCLDDVPDRPYTACPGEHDTATH